MEESEIPVYRLLQPEIMCRNELIQVLKKYNLKMDIASANNCELIEIYQKLALPLPQRKYGSTSREKSLTKKQIRMNKEEPEKLNYQIMSSSKSLSSPPSSFSNARQDRLKPPLDSTKIRENKVIKLSNSPSSSTDTSQNGGSSKTKKIVEREKSPNTNNEESDFKRKRIKIDFSDATAQKPTATSAKIARKASTEQDSKEPKSKHRRIVI